jgi:hypothetical protein
VRSRSITLSVVSTAYRSCGPCNRRRWYFWELAGLASREPSDAVLLRRLATFHAMRDGDLDQEEADFLVGIALKLEPAA